MTSFETHFRAAFLDLEPEALSDVVCVLCLLAENEGGMQPAAQAYLKRQGVRSRARAALDDEARLARVVDAIGRVQGSVAESGRSSTQELIGGAGGVARPGVVDRTLPRGGPLARLLFVDAGGNKPSPADGKRGKLPR